MGIEAQARITLKGGSQVLKELQGVSRGTRTASKEAQLAAKETERWQRLAIRSHQERMKQQDKLTASTKRAADEQARAQQKAAQDAAKSADKSARDQQRAAERAAEAIARAAQKAQRAKERSEVEATKAAQREAAKQVRLAERTAASAAKASREAWKRNGGIFAMVAGGVVGGGRAAFNTARSVTGGASPQERVQNALAYKDRFIRVTHDAGMSNEERAKAQGNILDASKATGADPNELLGAVEAGQGAFNDARFMTEHIKEIATIAKTVGSDIGEFGMALGAMKEAFGLTGEQTMEAAYRMRAAAAKGAIETKDFAGAFAPKMKEFVTNTHLSGMEGVSQFLGLSQGIGTGHEGASESATQLERLLIELNDKDTLEKLRKIGVSGFRDHSGRVDVQKFIEIGANNRQFMDPMKRQDIFTRVEALRPINSLLTARADRKAGKAEAEDFSSFAGVTAEEGRASVDAGWKDLVDNGSIAFAQEAAKMQAETIENLKGYTEQLLSVTKTGNELESSFGRLAFWADSIAQIGVGSVVGGFLKNALFGGGGGTPSPTLATGAEVVEGATKLGFWSKMGKALGGMEGGGGPLLMAGFGDHVRRMQNGEKPTSIGDEWILSANEWLTSLNPAHAATSRSAGTATRAASDYRMSDDALKEQTRVLREINDAVRAANNKPAPGGPREPR